MKKMFIGTHLLLLGVIALLSFKLKNAAPQPKINPFCADTLCGRPVLPLKGIIRGDLLKQMSATYAADSGKKYSWQGNRSTGYQDATSIWFDYQTLKTYFWYVERAMCRKGCDDISRLGIRIYYVKYPAQKYWKEHDELKGLPASYANQHTLCFVPTLRVPYNRTFRNKDFDPLGITRGCTADSIPGGKKALIFGLTGELTQPDADGQNHGGLAPPPANEGIYGLNQ